jgi:hypothetical protein
VRWSTDVVGLRRSPRPASRKRREQLPGGQPGRAKGEECTARGYDSAVRRLAPHSSPASVWVAFAVHLTSEHLHDPVWRHR